MINHIVLVVLLVCFFLAIGYAYSCIKEEMQKNKTFDNKTQKNDISPEEALRKFHELKTAGEIGEAQRMAKKYLCLDSNHHELRKLLAESYIETNKEYEAIANLSVLTNIYPDDLKMIENLASLYKKTRQTKKAIHYYSLILEKNKDDIDSIKNLADLYFQNKQKESALKLYKQLAFLSNDEAEKAYYNKIMGSIYSSYGEYQKALVCYEKVFDFDDTDVEVIRDMRRIYLKLKDTQKVIEYSEKLIELEPEIYIYYEDLINLFYHLKEYDKVLSYSKIAISLSGADIIELNNTVAKVYLNTGRIQEGINLINEILQHDPYNVVLVQTLAKGYCLDNNYEMARKVCEDALESALPSDIKTIRNNISSVLADEAIYLLRNGSNTEAFEKFNEAIKYNSENPEIYFKLADANVFIKNYSEAIRQCKRAIELSPQTGLYYEKLADIYYELQNYFDAKKAYKDVISIDPKNARAHAFLGILQAKDKENESAVKSLETAVALDPQNTDIIYNLALAYEYAGRKDDAISRYNEVLSIDPEHKEALNNLKLL